MKELKLAVIGKDVSKSDSPAMHSFIAERLGFKIIYRKISITEGEFEEKIHTIFTEFDGFNVTIPYKIAIIPHLKSVKNDALVFGAVNTVNTDFREGYNTDGLGFALMLKAGGVDVCGKEALVLGAGGAGRSVAKKLLDGGAKVSVFDMNAESAKKVAAEFEGVAALEELLPKPYFLIVNATGVGMHKSVGISPVGKELIEKCEVAVDLIYTPPKSEFLKIAEECGKKIINGSAMLFYQAYYSDCIYFGLEPDEKKARELFEEFSEVRK